MAEGTKETEADQLRRELDDTKNKLYETELELVKTKKKLEDMQLLQELGKQTNDRLAVNKGPTKSKSGTSHKKQHKPKKKAEEEPPPPPELSPAEELLKRLQTPVRKHPKVPGLDDDCESKEFYAFLAEKFEHMKLSDVLEAEKRFMAADKNHNGTIEMDEMDRMLTMSVTVFTQEGLNDILKEIDLDQNQAVDFVEALTIMQKLMNHRNTNLPSIVKQNATKVCVIQ